MSSAAVPPEPFTERTQTTTSFPDAERTLTYQVLARKWRPQDFSALIGQEPIVTALRNALRENRIAQAYLFAGIRGVGKTTAARVLAKALNCENGPAEDPCNECDTCREITAGSDLDVLEIDAATYSKVEQVRELTESLKYGPANDRYKVVVLDEVHRLSRQAFDALLKIVEEPPAHLTFIFATTEIDAVPATILSRCQEFHFRRVPVPVLADHLRALCDAESIETSDQALRQIARAGEGSVRDSVALLDQMATYGSGSITDEDANRLLGGLDTQLFQQILHAVFDGQRHQLTKIIRQIEDHGWDPRSAFTQLLGYCRSGLHLAAHSDQETESFDLSTEDAQALGDLISQFGFEALLRTVHLLLESEQTIKRSELPALALEVALLRAAELPRLIGIEKLLSEGSGSAEGNNSGNPGSNAGSDSGSKNASARNARVSSSAGQETSAETPPLRSKQTGARAADGVEVEVEVTKPREDRDTRGSRASSQETPSPVRDPEQAIATFTERLRSRPSLAAQSDLLEIRCSQEAIRIEIPADDDILAEQLERASGLLHEAATEALGPGATVSIQRSDRVTKSETDRTSTKAPPAVARPRRDASRDAAAPEPVWIEELDDNSSSQPTASEESLDGGVPPMDLDPSSAAGQSATEASTHAVDESELAELPAGIQAVLRAFPGKLHRVEPSVLGKSSDLESARPTP